MVYLMLPELWFKRTHVLTGVVFKERFHDANCPGWSKTALEDLHILARHRISILNTKMPDQWAYEVTGWELHRETS